MNILLKPNVTSICIVASITVCLTLPCSSSNGQTTTNVDTSASEMAPMLVRFATDRGAIQRSYNIALSPLRAGKMKQFFAEWQDALDAFEESRQLSHESGTFLQAEPDTLIWCARAWIELGEIERAKQAVEEAMTLGERMESNLHLTHAAYVQVKLARSSGASQQEFEAVVATALETAREKAPFYEPLIHLDCAAFAAEQDDEPTRRVELEAARDLLADMGVTARAEEITRQLA